MWELSDKDFKVTFIIIWCKRKYVYNEFKGRQFQQTQRKYIEEPMGLLELKRMTSEIKIIYCIGFIGDKDDRKWGFWI